MNNLQNPSKLTFTPVTVGIFTIVAGVAGWIDTDVSATTGVDPTKIWVGHWRSAGGDVTTGVRPHGGTGYVYATTPGIFICAVDNTGHMDFYRDAGTNITFYILGYLQ